MSWSPVAIGQGLHTRLSRSPVSVNEGLLVSVLCDHWSTTRYPDVMISCSHRDFTLDCQGLLCPGTSRSRLCGHWSSTRHPDVMVSFGHWLETLASLSVFMVSCGRRSGTKRPVTRGNSSHAICCVRLMCCMQRSGYTGVSSSGDATSHLKIRHVWIWGPPPLATRHRRLHEAICHTQSVPGPLGFALSYHGLLWPSVGDFGFALSCPGVRFTTIVSLSCLKISIQNTLG